MCVGVGVCVCEFVGNNYTMMAFENEKEKCKLLLYLMQLF